MMRKFTFTLMMMLATSFFTMCDSDDTKLPTPDPEPQPEVSTPVINVGQEFSINYEGGILEIPYSIANPAVNVSITVKTAAEDSWVKFVEEKESKLLFDIAAWDGEAIRSTHITLGYDKAENREVIITQTPLEIPEGSMTFDIQIKKIKSNEVVFDLQPSDKERTFVAFISDKSEIESISDWERYYQEKITFFIEQGMAYGATSEDEAIRMFLRQGDMLDYKVTMLKPLSDYYIVAYGMDPDRTITSVKATTIPFRTTQVEPVDMTFELNYKDCLDYTRLYITPTSTSDNFYWSVMKKSEFEAAGETLAQDIVDELMTKVDNVNVWMSEFLFIGKQSKNVKNLTPGEQYVLFAFGCHFKGVITTPVFKMEFTPQALDKVSCDFQIRKNNTRATYFSVDIIPSDDQVRWFAYTLPYSLLEDYYTNPEDMTDDALDIAAGLGVSWIEDQYVHTGRKSLISYQMLAEELQPNSSHFVGVMGINNQGVRITDLAVYKITTLSTNSEPSDMNVDINIEYIDGEVKANFTLDKMELYFYDIQPVEAYEEVCQGNDEIFANDILFHYNTAGILNTKLAFIPSYMQTAALEAGHDYYAVAFGYDSGLTTKVFKTRFTFDPATPNTHTPFLGAANRNRLSELSLWKMMHH